MTPLWSVVIPTRNRARALAGCLDALAAEAGSVEVVVVDDAGAMPLDSLVEPFRERLDLRLLRLDRPRGPAASRNAGVAEAQGELLAFTDDDCRPEPGWLAALARGLGGEPAPLAGGRVVNGGQDGPYAQASQVVLDLVYAHYNDDPSQARFLASNNMAITARDFRELGGFDATFRTSEDRELCDRWLYTGRRIAYVPDAVVRHGPDLSLPGYLRQHFGYGRGAWHFHRERARRGSGRLSAELSFYPSVARELPGRLAALPDRRAQTAGLLALWQVANAAGFAWEAGRAAAGRNGGG